jgi:peptidoglycan/LPS O-acetylase OafA/YrhL
MTADGAGYPAEPIRSDNAHGRLEREPATARQYRPDIDGLRAVAVLSVIFHHYLVPGFRGGFVGVDVFFVISGFLIAEHIDNDIRAGRFSLLTFYERRIRRIFPAFFVMYALALSAAWMILFPRDMQNFLIVALRVIPFLANFILFKRAGEYGGDYASSIPLLHTWSLAVEEQFYLFFPLLMLAIAWGAARRRVMLIGSLALASFASCVVIVHAVPSAAFFLTPFRAWELLAGALLALARVAPPRQAYVRSGTALAGLLLIIAADLFFSYAIPHPGELTLLPCAGAVAIIYACPGPATLPGRVLGNPLMRRIGWWSYSLYLYHWPLWVLAKYYFFEPLSASMRAVLMATSLLLGWLSWAYVEQPFRRPKALLGRRAVYGLAASAGAVLILATFLARHLTDPRLSSAQQQAQFPRYTPLQERCRGSSPDDTQKPACKLGDAGAPAETVLWGDSHALALLPAFDAAYAGHHEAVMFAQQDGCPALLGVHIRDAFPAASDFLSSWLDTPGSSRAARCYQHTALTLSWIIQRHIRTVILAGHWTAYAQRGRPLRLTDSQSPHNYHQLDNGEIFSRGLERVLAALDRQHVRIFILDDVPESIVYVPYALASARRLGLQRDFRISRAEYELQQRNITDIFARLQRRYAFRILKPQDYLCADGFCAIARNGDPLYADEDHLAPFGAKVAEPALEAIWSER